MDEVRLRQERLRSHRLTAPAASPVAAARHMLAVQSQEFWGGRWALAIRSRGEPGISVVDRAFDDGRLVRSWTQRGTLHVVPAEDLGWMLALTADRQFRSAAGRHRALGLDEAAFGAAERAVRVALAGGDRLTRDQVRDVIEAAGVDTAGQRSVHLLQALSLRGVICHGPVVHRDGGIAREQYLVLCEDWITDPVSPPQPAAEAFVRFIDGHGPAGVADFCWWSGLTLTAGREAAAAAAGRVRPVGDGLFVALRPPRRVAGGPDVLALPAFDEYYLSYADRGPVCGPGHQEAVGPGANGLVSPTLLSAGVVVGRWTHSRALGRRDAGRAEVFEEPTPSAEAVTAALDRYTAFVTG